MVIQSHTCSIAGCKNKRKYRFYCAAHYQRAQKGDLKTDIPVRVAAKPKAHDEFIRDLVANPPDGCVDWPFAKDKRGYGVTTLNGSGVTAGRRVLLEFAGPPPQGRNHAAHKCGRGTQGCVSPSCLYWASPQENSNDRIRHGNSLRGEENPSAILTEVQAISIYKDKRRHWEIAIEYGVTKSTVSHIKRGVIWGWLTQPLNA